jgi:hypothetical protein
MQLPIIHFELSTSTIEHPSLVDKPMPGDFSINITNVTGGDIQFLTDLVALFCDPRYADKLAGLRKGTHGIYRDPLTHQCLVSDLFTPPIILEKQKSKN